MSEGDFNYGDPKHINQCTVNNPMQISNEVQYRVRSALSHLLILAEKQRKTPKSRRDFEWKQTSAAIKALNEIVPLFTPQSESRCEILSSTWPSSDGNKAAFLKAASGLLTNEEADEMHKTIGEVCEDKEAFARAIAYGYTIGFREALAGEGVESAADKDLAKRAAARAAESNWKSFLAHAEDFDNSKADATTH